MSTTGVGATGSSGGTGSTDQADKSSNDALRGLDLDHFLKLMITELQNQDPLNPLENHQILQQISQIREIGATTQLQDTLESVLRGQNLANASSLIDKHVTALDAEGNEVNGKVERVSVAENKVQLHIGDQTIDLKNLREILPAA